MTPPNTMKLILTGLLTLFLAASALAQNPYAKPDDTWISISGEVRSVSPDEFVLDFGEDNIIVEMDDGDRDADAYKLVEGDKVTVNGLIDDDFFETTTIEASSVYVEKLDTYFYASAMDEEDAFVTVVEPVVVSATVMQGTVTEVNDEEFRLDTGTREIIVEVEEMSYDPLDDLGYQQIDVGDRVSVTGQLDYDFLEGQEFVATSIVTLAD
jgi:uncharacterized protein YdeI (BOF family)